MSWCLRSHPAPSWLVVVCRAGSPGSHARREQSVHIHGVVASRSQASGHASLPRNRRTCRRVTPPGCRWRRPLAVAHTRREPGDGTPHAGQAARSRQRWPVCAPRLLPGTPSRPKRASRKRTVSWLHVQPDRGRDDRDTKRHVFPRNSGKRVRFHVGPPLTERTAASYCLYVRK
jgi:hypothetical protein